MRPLPHAAVQMAVLFPPPTPCDFQGRQDQGYKQAGCQVAVTESDYINDDILLQWLQHFQEHRSPGRCLLISEGHASHSSLKRLVHCQDDGSEILRLPPRTTQVLSLVRILLKTIKMYYRQATTNFLHNHSNATVTKFRFGKPFSRAWKKQQQLEMLSEGFSAQVCLR